MRIIKFRGKSVEDGKWVVGCLVNNLWFKSELTDNPGQPIYEIIPDLRGEDYDDWSGVEYLAVEVISETVGQCSGIQDKHNTDIWEHDLVRIRKPKRSTQVHTGNNIPNGRYEEPLEPDIEEKIFEVRFENGCFVLGNKGDLLCWNIGGYDLENAIDGFSGHWANLSGWGGEDGDLAYLLERYSLKTENDLLAYLGIEIIGNLFDNPELLIK